MSRVAKHLTAPRKSDRVRQATPAMPRQARLDISATLQHIMVRGINKSDIFKDDQDKILFLERLGQNVIHGKCSLYAWVLIENHLLR